MPPFERGACNILLLAASAKSGQTGFTRVCAIYAMLMPWSENWQGAVESHQILMLKHSTQHNLSTTVTKEDGSIPRSDRTRLEFKCG